MTLPPDDAIVVNLDMAVRYGRRLDAPPRVLPSGWAALLELYGLR